MFWSSVGSGLSMLGHWETYGAGIIYVLMLLLPMAAIGSVMSRGGAADGGLGCLSMLLMPLLQVAAMLVFAMTLFPLIFGLGDEAAWSFPWKMMSEAPWLFFKFAMLSLVAVLLLAFIPILGQLQSLHTLVIGGFAMALCIRLMDSISPLHIVKSIDLVPGFWFTTGLIIVGGLLSWVAMLAAAAITTLIDRDSQGPSMLVMFPLGAVFGFIPVFIYGAWLGEQLRDLVQ